MSRIRSDRCIATGLIWPRPALYGWLSALIAASVSTITVVAEPMSIAWEPTPSPLSAKNSMKVKTTPAIRKRTSQIEVGMMPSAPWSRSRRPASRSEVWSSHLLYAACSLAVFGFASCRLRKSAIAHGLIVSPPLPASICGHSWCTTERP